MKKAEMLTEDFSTGYSSKSSQETYGSGGTASVSAGQLQLQNSAASTGGIILKSQESFDLENSSVAVDIPNAGPISPTRVTFLFLTSRTDNESYIFLGTTGVGVVGQSRLKGAANDVVHGYANLSGMPPGRVRIRSVQNTIYFERQSGGSYQTIGTATNVPLLFLQNLSVSLRVSCYQDMDCVTGTSTFDNVNLPTP
jgi:hypothetical protein